MLRWSLDAVSDHLDVVGFQESGNKWTWVNLTPTGATYGRGVVTFVRPVEGEMPGRLIRIPSQSSRGQGHTSGTGLLCLTRQLS